MTLMLVWRSHTHREGVATPVKSSSILNTVAADTYAIRNRLCNSLSEAIKKAESFYFSMGARASKVIRHK